MALEDVIYGFNDSTVTFGTTTFDAKIRSAGFNETCPEVDTTGAGDTEATSEPGKPKKDGEVEFLGECALTAGQKGTLSFAFADGETITVGYCYVVSRSKKGQLNGVNVWSVKFAKTSEQVGQA